MPNSIITILKDIKLGTVNISIYGMLGWNDVRQKYRRSKLGPFWLTINMGILISVISIVFGSIYKIQIDYFILYISMGLIFWNFISSMIADGCHGFIHSESIIKQLPIPLFSHIMRVLWRNLIVLAHNLLILPVIFLAMHKLPPISSLLALPALLLIILNLAWIVLLLAIICARFRDITQIVANLMQILFYATPIIWLPTFIPDNLLDLVYLNPIYYFLEIIRGPILGEVPHVNIWIVPFIFLIPGWILVLIIFKRYKNRIVYWL